MVHFDVREIAPGVRLHVSRDARWKTTLICARIAAALDDDATRTALVPAVLARGTERSPTARELSIRLESLYDAELDADALRLGDAQVVEVRLDVVARRYVPRGAAAGAAAGPKSLGAPAAGGSGGADPLAEGLALMGEVLFAPALDAKGRFRADVVRSEKANLKRHIEGLRDERAEYAIERAARLLGRGEPSARYEYGDVKELRAIGPEDLADRWRALVERHPLDILAVGDVDAAEVEALLREALPLARRAPAGSLARVPPPSGAPRPAAALVREREQADVKQAHLCLGFRTGIAYLDGDYAGLLVLHALLGADAQSRLFLRVREEAGLAYEAGTILDRAKGTITAHCGVDPENAARCEALVDAEVARLREEPVAAGELDEARKFTLARLGEVEDEPGLRVAFGYGRALLGQGEASLEGLLERVRAVGPAEVRAAARRLVKDCVFELTAK